MSEEIDRLIEDDSTKFKLAWYLSRFVLLPVLYPYTNWWNSTKYHGLENIKKLNRQSFIVCMNHTASFDIWGGFQVGFESLQNYFSKEYYLCGLGASNRIGSGLVKRFAINAGVLPVDRSKGIEQYALQEAVRILNLESQKVACLVYPEGTRSKSGYLATDYKAGAGYIQAMTNVPVLPVYQTGYNELPGRGKQIHVHVGEPLFFDEFQEKKDSPTSWITITNRIMDVLYDMEDRIVPEAKNFRTVKTKKTKVLVPDKKLEAPFVDFNDEFLNPMIAYELRAKEPRFRKITELNQLSKRTSNMEVINVQSPKHLGSTGFKKLFGLDYAYFVSGLPSYTHGRGMLQNLFENGMLGFFNLDGLTFNEKEESLNMLNQHDFRFGVEIHLDDFDEEEDKKLITLLMAQNIKYLLVKSCSKISEPLIRFKSKEGNLLIAKVSHPDQCVALSSGKKDVFSAFLIDGSFVSSQDTRSILSLMPSIKSLLNEKNIYLGVTGDLGTPDALAAAFAMGADFVSTSSINLLSNDVSGADSYKECIKKVRFQDVSLVSSFESFESGAKTRALNFGTRFVAVSTKIGSWFFERRSIDTLEDSEVKYLEEKVFGSSITQTLLDAKAFFEFRNPSLIEAASNNSRISLAMLIRYYLEMGHLWAIEGNDNKKIDYNIKCGLDLASFNQWRQGTIFEDDQKLSVVQIALNLMMGAQFEARKQFLKSQGIEISPDLRYEASILPS
ncbi:MAG: 1-acyl-sn-glycerol-3-phosphate acyltransferase [Candidatus Cloacimonetes bacterium]|nr:1-acyl-sn-glycerol-3-phosphate acyltransferase [Candidatus Cloacimonadota bacterium]